VFTLDGSRLITFGDDRQFRFWKTADGSLERSLPLPEELTEGTLFPDGRTAFAVHRQQGFALFDLITGSITRTSLPPLNITNFAFDQTGERFTTAAQKEWSQVWSTRTGAPLTPPLNHGGEVRWVDFSPDGKMIVTAGLTPEARVWDVSTGEQLFAPLRLGAKPLEVAHWSLDGRFIVARSDDNLVRVWDSATGEAVTPLLKHSGYVRLASLVANNRLVTLSLPNLMRAWDLHETPLPLDVLSDYAKLLSGRRLNAQGVMLALKSQELAELSRSLRARAPQLFATP
jgi:WD40 repeat protein